MTSCLLSKDHIYPFCALSLTDHCYQDTIQSHSIFQSMRNFHECAESVMCLRAKRYTAKRRHLRWSTSQTLPITWCFKINKLQQDTEKRTANKTLHLGNIGTAPKCIVLFSILSIFRCVCKIAKSDLLLSYLFPSSYAYRTTLLPLDGFL